MTPQQSTLKPSGRPETPGSTCDGSAGAVATFCVVLPYPPTVNTLWRRVGNRTLLSAKGREYHAQVADRVTAQAYLVGHSVPPAPHDVTVTAWVPDRRKRDIDNIFKAIFDPLYRTIGLDDSVIVDLQAHKRYDGHSSSVVVTIRTAEEA